MPFGYLIKINKMRPNSQSCVVKKTQNGSFVVVDPHRFAIVVQKSSGIAGQRDGKLIFLDLGVGNAKFGEAVAESVAGEAEGPGGLTFIATRAAEGFSNGLIFPLFERHSRRQDVRRVRRGARRSIVEINVG